MAQRIIQPATAKRVSFATWARRNGIRRTSSVTFVVPDSVDVPKDLMAGATIDGKAASRGGRRRKTADRGPVSEPGPVVAEGQFPENPPEPEVTSEEERNDG